MKKFILFFLCLLVAFSCSACKGGGAGDSGSSDSSDNPSSEVVTDNIEHFQSGTLHKINVKENKKRVFAENGSSDYVIVTGSESSYAKRAASFIVSNVKKATGAVLRIVALTDEIENGWNSDKKYILLNCKSIFGMAGLTMPSDNLGESGYYIKTSGNTVFIMNPEELGYQMGAYKFLEEVLGYDMLAAGCVVYEKDGRSIPDMEIIEKPDYDYRTVSNFTVGRDDSYGMGFNMTSLNSMFIPVPNRTGQGAANAVHNSYDYLPPSMYAAEHPSWFSHPGNENEEQLCYTAHGAYLTADEDKKNGTPNEYNLMVETLYEYLKELVDLNPDMNNITITHQDNMAYCDCDACTAAVNKYGAISSVYIMFLNRVDELLQADLAKEAAENGTEKRLVNILFFAYHGTKDSPTYKGDDGEYHPTYPEVVMNKNVGVFVAAIESYYTESFYENTNIELGESELIRSWSCLTDNVYMWLYSTHFTNYIYPYATWDSVVESYRFCYENSGIYMFNEGQINQKNPTGFTKLKEYIDAKALVNVNVNYKELEAKFFRYYFADAAEPMYNYFRELRSRLAYIGETDVSISGRLNIVPDNKKHWQRQTLLKYMSYIDKAYAAIEKYKTLDPELYGTLKDRIVIESIFPRYALLDIYPSSFSKSELDEARRSFMDDNTKLKNSQVGEHKTLKDLYTMWGY